MQQILKIEPIYTIQIHMHPSHLYTFYNTFYIEVLKKYAKGIVIIIVQHEHPLHRVSDLPFAIVNATHIIPRAKLQGLVDSVCTHRPHKMLLFKPIVQLCEQIASIGRITSEQPSNPYYLLLSPLKKYQIYKANNTFKHQFYQNTQYFNHDTDQLNKQHFLYKLDILSTYITNIDKTEVVVLCIYALMKSLKIDNKMLYETLVKNQMFGRLEREGLGLVAQPIRVDMMNQVRFIATVPADSQQKRDNQNNKQSANIFMNPKLQFLSRLIVPAIAFTVFWRFHKGQSAPNLATTSS